MIAQSVVQELMTFQEGTSNQNHNDMLIRILAPY